MAQAAQKIDEDQVPGGGIADFIMSDEEISALEEQENREAADEVFGDEGIANFQEVASRMASYGRYGDDTVAHVETGELIVPKALIDQNPRLKASIFNHLREMGVEDPERYVVGTDLNSINPETGLPEFFSFNPFKAVKKVFKGAKKAVSKVAKGVSKVFKSVGKILKKAAPVILPIVGTLAFGPIYGAALGSGIGTLIQGGDLKDAFKSALISGATGAVTAGVGSKLRDGTFIGGVKDAANTANISAGFDSLGKAVTGDFSGFSTANMLGGPASEGGTAFEAAAAGDVATTEAARAQALAGGDQAFAGQTAGGAPLAGGDAAFGAQGVAPAAQTTGGDMFFAKQPGGPVSQSFADAATQGAQATQPSLLDRAGNIYSDYLSPSRNMPTSSDIAQKAGELMQTGIGSKEATALATKELTPGLISRFAPLAAAGTTLAAGSGFFTAPPVEDPNLVQRDSQGNVITGEDLIALNPDDYLIQAGGPRRAEGDFEVQSPYTILPGGRLTRNPFSRPQMYAAEGGEVYPRRNGGIMPNEGVPDQDSVRALLMPGEFVMTKDAVRGLGNGNLNQGINNMYSMMRNLEAKGQRA